MLFPHTKSNVLWIVRSGLMNAQTELDRHPGTLCLGDFTLNQPSRGDCWISNFCKVLTLLCQLLRDYILYILPRPRNSFLSPMKDMSLKLLHQIEFMQYILVLL